jgi:hypothetical protein
MLGYQHMKFEPFSATPSQYINAGAKAAKVVFGWSFGVIFHKNMHWLPDDIFNIRNAQSR